MNPLRLPAWLIKLLGFAKGLTKKRRILGRILRGVGSLDRLENRQMAGFLAAPTPQGVSMGGASWFSAPDGPRAAAVVHAANPVADRSARPALEDIARAAQK